ncbi:MAG: aminopeptidase P [Osedax symbiont Rs1]|nr:MAG: aminopeptidase P [Osedax symbiont Rs1]
MIENISQVEFSQRRAALLQQLEDNCAVIIQSAPMVNRNSDVDYLFRQDSDFFYFTGFNEPDAVLLLTRVAGEVQYQVFCQPRDKKMEIWFGYRCGEQGLLDNFNVDAAYSNDLLAEKMPELLNGVKNLYYSLGRVSLNERVHGWLATMRKRSRQGVIAPSHLLQLDDVAHEMRLIKSATEQDLLRRASEISAQAHIIAMQVCKEQMMEFQLDAHIQHHFAMNGSQQAAYPSIVGGGKNACVLHYIENNQQLKSGDLVLIDAGAEYQYYAGDITRTFPINGKFSAEQAALYEVVLQANLECTAMIKPGTSWGAIHDHAVLVITSGLQSLGLLKGELHELIESESYREFFMHKLGHWLGMDVHDVGNYKQAGEWRQLQAGMVMTVEPGIYVAIDNMDVEARWRGIGIRIEDDVLITATGCEVMTESVPKTIVEIEALMAGGSV